jgi:hypothetical protein
MVGYQHRPPLHKPTSEIRILSSGASFEPVGESFLVLTNRGAAFSAVSRRPAAPTASEMLQKGSGMRTTRAC